MGNLGNRVATGVLAAVLAISGVPTAALAKAVYEGRGWPCTHAEPVDEATSGEACVEPAPPTSPLCLAVTDADEPGERSVHSVSYLDEGGEGASHECADIADLPDEQGVTLSDGWFVVRKDKSFSEHCLSVTGDVNLVLCDGATLTCSYGIRNLGTLTVWAQSDATAEGNEEVTGKLVATGGKRHAGIGGWDEGESGGKVTIRGGFIEAHGGTDAAGIGGAYKGDGGTITISGGDVRAYGNDNGAGIGGGEYGRGGKITVSGGRVRAEAEDGNDFNAAAAGIGGGEDRDGGEIEISGGEVTAVGGYGVAGSGAGIGGGDEGSGGRITISGGTITARGGSGHGAGIGGGECGNGGEVEISGGTVNATGRGGAAGIGGGDEGSGGEVTITGGTVTANSGHGGGAGIGGGNEGDGGHVKISGGRVIAEGRYSSQYSGAGIGGGDDGDGGTIEIHGGEVFASSTYMDGTFDDAWGAGIGGGDDGDTGKVTVDGGMVEAHGYQAIGHGEDGDDGGLDRGEAVNVDSAKVQTLVGPADGRDCLMLECSAGGISGSCLWGLMPDGQLRLLPYKESKPALGEPSEAAGARFPWLAHRDKITSVTFGRGVALPGDCSGMFGGCTALERVEAAGVDASSVTNMGSMFSGCSQLRTITVGEGWSTAGVEEGSSMFEGCDSLVGGNGTKYSSEHVDSEYARVDAPGTPGYLTQEAGEAAPAPAPAPAFRRANLTVGQQVGLTFWLALPEADGLDYSGSYVELSVDDKDGRTVELPLSEVQPSQADGLYGLTIDLTPVEMAEPVTAVFHYADGGEEKAAELTYSVRQYLEDFDAAVAANPGAYTDKVTALVHATADLGHFMQPYLSQANGWAVGTDYEEMGKHYREMGEDDVAAAKAGVADKRISGSVKGSGIKGVGAQLSFGSLTEVDVYLTPADPDAQVTASASYGGRTFPAVKQADGRWLVRVEGIKPYDFGQTITVSGNGGTGDFTVSVSVLGVANVDLSAAGSAERDQAYASAYYLWDAARAI